MSDIHNKIHRHSPSVPIPAILSMLPVANRQIIQPIRLCHFIYKPSAYLHKDGSWTQRNSLKMNLKWESPEKSPSMSPAGNNENHLPCLLEIKIAFFFGFVEDSHWSFFYWLGWLGPQGENINFWRRWEKETPSQRRVGIEVEGYGKERVLFFS